MPPPAVGFASRLVLGPALRTQPDRRLVALVREGYEAAFEEIVRRYGKPLTRYAAAIVGARSEDVTQDAFSKALLALRRDGPEIELRPWLFRIVRNTALNDLRDRPHSAEALADAIAGGRNPAEELERREELTDLMRRLQSLPEPQRAAIVMRELEGLSHEEIAAALGLSGGAARQAIYRARQALRDGLGMLLPFPLLRFLVDHGGETAASGAAGGVAAASGAAGGAGAGVALKAGAVTMVLAGSVGTGIALQERGHGDRDATASAAAGTTGQAGTPASPAQPANGDAPESNSSQRHGDPRQEDSGDGGRGPGDNSGPGGDRIDPQRALTPAGGNDRGPHEQLGPGHRGHRQRGLEDHGGPHGPGRGGHGEEHARRESRSGPGPGSGDGHGGGGRSGSGAGSGGSGGGPRPEDDGSGGNSGPSEPPPPPEEELREGEEEPESGEGSRGSGGEESP